MKASFRLRPSILLFGDSITQYGFGHVDSVYGWAGLLSAAYQRRADVLNRGFSGYNTRHAIELLPRVFEPDQTADLLFCTVFFGANDAALPGEPQHVPMDEYAKNIDGIVVKIREVANGVPIILLTPPPVDEEAWKKHRDIEKSDRDNHVTREYGQKLKQVAAMHEQCSVVDTWELLKGDTADRGQYLSDGLHLNEQGNTRIYQGLLDTIQTNYPHLAPMRDDDGDGRYGKEGIPLEEKLWKELCGLEDYDEASRK